MKTPREILWQQHRRAEPKLDRLRAAFLREELSVRSTGNGIHPAKGAGFARKLWLELILPCRRTWAGLAAVWVAIALFHFQGEESERTEATGTSGRLMEANSVYAEQRQLFAELDQTPEAWRIEPRKRFSPRPRSERRQEILMG